MFLNFFIVFEKITIAFCASIISSKGFIKLFVNFKSFTWNDEINLTKALKTILYD